MSLKMASAKSPGFDRMSSVKREDESDLEPEKKNNNSCVDLPGASGKYSEQ